MASDQEWERWRNTKSTRKWDRLGDRYVTFINGQSKMLNITEFVRDSEGHPVMVECSDGSFYVWSNILCIL